mmetsp:Transcript_2113/g.6630  ORF Transcript_2113/g.6630 Transcript_2113/m.6630 type:complete len:200 (-) Transcript_2113:603-1202(-)
MFAPRKETFTIEALERSQGPCRLTPAKDVCRIVASRRRTSISRDDGSRRVSLNRAPCSRMSSMAAARRSAPAHEELGKEQSVTWARRRSAPSKTERSPDVTNLTTAPTSLAPRKEAPLSTADVRSASAKSAPLRSAPERSALARFAFRSRARRKEAPASFASVIVATERSAPSSAAPLRSTPSKSEAWRSSPRKLARRR